MALVKNGCVALETFLTGCLLFIILLILGLFHERMNDYRIYLSLIYAVVMNIVVYNSHRETYDVAIRSLSLGLGLSLSLCFAFSSSSYHLLGWYLSVLCVFHWGEYFVTAYANPRNLSLESFLLDHSREYHIAIAVSFTEFLVECFLFPGTKQPGWLSYVGLGVVVFGDTLRKLAMLTATTNFNHYVQHLKQDGHQLVTSGIYGLTRHPSYVGWFYWSVGTQIMLCNPLCTMAYAYVSWRFFKERIEIEEISLINFFGEDYLNYQKKVGTGLPFIRGYRMEL